MRELLTSVDDFDRGWRGHLESIFDVNTRKDYFKARGERVMKDRISSIELIIFCSWLSSTECSETWR